MSNHTHEVLYVDKELALSWSMKEVIEHWHGLHKGTLLTQKYMCDEVLSEGEPCTLHETVSVYRQRLYDISWFMRNLSI